MSVIALPQLLGNILATQRDLPTHGVFRRDNVLAQAVKHRLVGSLIVAEKRICIPSYLFHHKALKHFEFLLSF